MGTGHASNFLDFQPGNGLLIGDDRQCFQQHVRQHMAFGLLGNLYQIFVQLFLRTHLHVVLNLHQLDSAVFPRIALHHAVDDLTHLRFL